MNTFDIEIKAVFHGVGEKCFEWSVTLIKGNQSYSCPLKWGLGHCKRARPHARGAIQTKDRDLARVLKPSGKLTISDMEEWIVPTPPKLEDVLQVLQTDAQSGEHELFEDFAREFGYDEDSRKAEAIWHECRKIRGHMRRLLGADFEAFLAQEQN